MIEKEDLKLLQRLKEFQRIEYMRGKNLQIASVVFFLIGLFSGLYFTGMSVWADFEASIFDAALTGATFPGLQCPIMIGKDQVGIVKGDVVNSLDRRATLTVRTHSTSGALTLLNETLDNISLAPGEMIEVQWTVVPEDAIWGNFILFRVYQFGSYPMPAKTSACGILVSSVPLASGEFVVAALVLISAAGMGLGIWLWVVSHKPFTQQARDTTVAMTAIALILGLGIIFSLLGMWLAGVFAFLLTVILLVAMMSYFAYSRRARL
jgi:disulfide bond formation protein DsbB